MKDILNIFELSYLNLSKYQRCECEVNLVFYKCVNFNFHLSQISNLLVLWARWYPTVTNLLVLWARLYPTITNLLVLWTRLYPTITNLLVLWARSKSFDSFSSQNLNHARELLTLNLCHFLNTIKYIS